MAGLAIFSSFVCLVVATANGQQPLWQDAKCRKQLQSFHECRSKIFLWKEQEERNNATLAMLGQCLEKYGCMNASDLPHDLEWRKQKCSEDVLQVVKQKVVSCVRLRVSPDFELPEKNAWAYGRIAYEPIPLRNSTLDSLCKKGDLQAAKNCYQEITNHSIMNNVTERTAHFEKACARRAECSKLLDDECLAQYDAYRRGLCECAYDVHELYGGKRLMRLVPSCAGLVNDQKTRYLAEYKQRDSCALEDLNERDALSKICEYGYEKFAKMMKEKMSTTTTTPASTAKTTGAKIRK